MDSAFVQMLKALIPPVNTERFDSRRAFIRAVGTDDEHGDQGYLTKVLRGTRPPPLSRIEAWANALDLNGEKRQEFLDLAYIANISRDYPEAQGRLVSVLRQLKSQQAAIDVLKVERDRLKVRLAALDGGSP